MSQRSALIASVGKPTADPAAQRVQPKQQGQQPSLPQNLLHLQQTVGNRATRGLLSAGLLQSKLRIGPAGDSFEREADRMADAVMRMPESGTGANATQVAQIRSGNVQRVCSECEEELRRQPMEDEEEEEELLQAKPSTNASPPVNAGVETRIASLHGGGQPLSPAQRSFFEPRFDHDFGDVRVHTGGTAADSARAIKARAFTVGRDIAFGAGQYAPESRSGRRLLAHELTHTIQQTPLVARRKPFIQRQPDASTDMDSAFDQTESESPIEGPVEQPEQVPAGPESEPETPFPGETPAPGLIVEDETSELGPGQMGRSAFLAELRSGVCAAADEPLAGTQYTAQGCPTIELYLRIAEGFSAERIERELVRFMPEAAGITDAREYIPLIAARVRRSVEVWVQTGEITGMPEGLPTGLLGLGILAGILFKARNGGPRGNANPQAVQAQLGAGRPMNGSVRSRMGSAFGQSFSNVRVHTDSSAAQLSNRFNARAFTVGNHVAFGTGEYRPGTLMGDALIAHELAHTVQQGGANTSVAPMQLGNTGTSALENDADRSAVGAVASLWGDANKNLSNIVKNAIPRLRSGLSLQRCKTKTGTRTTSPGAPAAPQLPAVVPGDCVSTQPLTWVDFQGTPSGTASAETGYDFDVINVQGRSIVRATHSPSTSWVKPLWGDPTNRAATGCRKNIKDCKTFFASVPPGQKGAWALDSEPSTKCPAAIRPNASVEATSKADCDGKIATECDRAVKAESDRLLVHERLHFDIACLLTRKGNVALAASASPNPNQMVATVETRVEQVRQDYDDDTDSSCEATQQANWEADVQNGLPTETVP